MVDGSLKIRYSTGYKILELINLTVGDEPKSSFAHHVNKSMLKMYNKHPDAFIR